MSNGAQEIQLQLQHQVTDEPELLCNDPAKDAALRELCKQTGYTIKQENGQRKYGGPPPNWNDVIPGKGCEIFVGKLPRDLYEDELVPVLEQCGRIYELRLMMDFNGNNRGFAFVKYTTQKEAKLALKDLNNHEIRKGRLLGVCKSVDNCRLFVGGIPKSKQKQEILIEMQKLAEGVVDVIVYPAAADKTKNRGFAFVEFQDHHTAAMARRKLQHTRPQVWGHPLAVDWAEPEVEVDDDVMAQVKILYVRNLMLHTTEDQLEREFTAVVPSEYIERVKKIRDYGFVHFNSRENAVKCMKALNGKLLDGAPMEVTLAKPVDRETYVRYTRANNRTSTETPESHPTPFSGFVTTTYDPRFDPSGGAGAYSFTPSGPIYYGQVPYATTALPTVQQLQRYPMPTIRGGIAPQAVLPSLGVPTIGAAGVPLGIPGATTGVTSSQGRLSGAGSLRSGHRNRAAVAAGATAAASRGMMGRNGGGYLANMNRGFQTTYYNQYNRRPNNWQQAQHQGISDQPGQVEKYDLLPDTELTPITLSSLKTNQKSQTQLLEEYCTTHSLERPVYSLHSAIGPNGQQLFLYRVELPPSKVSLQHPHQQLQRLDINSNNSSSSSNNNNSNNNSYQPNSKLFTPTKLCISPKVAQEIAAAFVLDKLNGKSGGKTAAAVGFDIASPIKNGEAAASSVAGNATATEATQNGGNFPLAANNKGGEMAQIVSAGNLVNGTLETSPSKS